MNETDTPKFKYDVNETVLYVNTVDFFIESVIVRAQRMFSFSPAYYVERENGEYTLIPESKLFSSKRDAAAAMIRFLKETVTKYRDLANHFQNKLDYFQSANFQMRYMGEVIE